MLTKVCADRERIPGWLAVAELVTEDIGWATSNGNGKGREFEAKRTELLQGVRQGKYAVVLLWAIDRRSRRGTEDMMRYLWLLAEAGADVRSLKDPWLHTSDPLARELLVGVFSTLARYESQRRSDRIRAGLARRKAEGPSSGPPARGHGQGPAAPERVHGSLGGRWRPPRGPGGCQHYQGGLSHGYGAAR